MANDEGSAEPHLFDPRFKRILRTVEQELLLGLQKARDTTSHAGDKGASVEANVRDMLRNHLPATYEVGHGTVYDAYDDESKQTDVIITNSDHPIRYTDDRSGAYFVDGVSAVGEVKSVLTTAELDNCIEKGSAFKRLRPSLSEGDYIIGPAKASDAERSGTAPFFVFAFENKVAMKTITDRLTKAPAIPVPEGKEYDNGQGNQPQPPIDVICVLGQGFYIFAPPGDVPLKIYIGAERITGWVGVGDLLPHLQLLWGCYTPQCREFIAPLRFSGRT